MLTVKNFCILHIIPFLVGHHKGAPDVTTQTPYVLKIPLDTMYLASFALYTCLFTRTHTN